MALMLPPYIDKNCKSNGERIIFELLKLSPFTKDWTVLHSLNLSEHAKRLFGEIDFLLLIPGCGIFVIEVKGGDVKSINGEWQFINRSGHSRTGNSPFAQAHDAMFSLKSAIRKKFGADHRFNSFQFGYCVAFPDISFDIASVEYHQWQVFDKEARQNDPQQFFREFIFQTTEKHKDQPWFSDESLPSAFDLTELCDFLRGDFVRLRSVEERLEEFNTEVRSYTKEQFKLLDSIHENERCLVKGSAGTGKTMIAIESAVRAAADGKRVFLTCYNRLVGQWMQKQLGQWNDRITVSSLHGYLENIAKGLDHDRSQQNFFTSYMPALAKEIFDKNIIPKFDRLIIDEGQDLITPQYLALFDSMLNGGLINGQWEIYSDFERQAIFTQLSKDQMLSLINGFIKPVNFVLTINCRNTREIGEETSLLSGFEKPPFLLEHLEGIPVDYIFYENETEKMQKLTTLLQKLKDQGLPDKDLIILSPRKFENAFPVNLPTANITELKTIADTRIKGTIWFSTIQGYKGMESNYVILKDIDDLSGEAARSLLYVGMTRAKYGLILMLKASAREQVYTILKNKLK
jgi:hypothetical protein